MKTTNNQLDEMQEQKLLQIEHNGCWLAFWGLLVAMGIQILLGNTGVEHLAGEWVVFMGLAIYLMYGCIKNGIWDRRLQPNFKTNATISTIAAIIMGVFWFFVTYHNYGYLTDALLTGVLMFVCIEILCLVALTVTSRIHKKRLEKLETVNDDSDEE